MNCLSCGSPVLSSFVWSLQANQCPSCGGPIFDPPAKELLDELTEAMKNMEGNPAGLAGWLLSNYHLQKIGDAQPVEFYGQRQNAPGISRQADNHGQGFMQRAGLGVKDQEKHNKLAQIAQELRGAQDHMYGDGNSDIGDQIEYDGEIQPRTPEEMAFVRNAMPFGNAKTFGAASLLASSGGNISSGELSLVSQFAEEAAEKASQVHPAVERERLKRLAKQEQNSHTDDSGRPIFKFGK